MQWEKDFDCIKKMKEWILESKIATGGECDKIQEEAKKHVLESKTAAWRKFNAPLKEEIAEAIEKIEAVGNESGDSAFTNDVYSATQDRY